MVGSFYKEFNGNAEIKFSELNNFCSGKRIILYGAGSDCSLIINEYPDINIVEIIDNGKDGQFYNGIDIVSVERFFMESMTDDSVIIIASHIYDNEMANSLKDKGLKVGKDYYFIDFTYGKDVKKFINHNETVWNNNSIEGSKDEIIVPVVPYADNISYSKLMILYSYAANYLSKKYRSIIKGSVLYDTEYDVKLSKSILDICKSWNMKEIIPFSFTEDMVNETNAIYDSVIRDIRNFDDWNSVKIHGYNYGITIMRRHLRFDELNLDPLNEEYLSTLKESIILILFWEEYFKNHSVRAVISVDGIYYEGIMCHIAISQGIPVYSLTDFLGKRIQNNEHMGYEYPYLHDFFNMLDKDEQDSGREWGRRQLEYLIRGDERAYIPYRTKIGGNNIFEVKKTGVEIPHNNKLGVVIFPHIFNEDSWQYGEQLYSNYLGWLCFMGEMSNNYDYNWYIKMHPDEKERGEEFIEKFVKKYPNIQLLPKLFSPADIKEMDIKYVFTIYGSVGHEFPFYGINVINAGNNPHMAFDFCINPQSREELENIIKNLEVYDYKPCEDQIFEYYYISYNCYDENPVTPSELFEFDKWHEEELWQQKKIIENTLYSSFCSYWNEEWHEKLQIGISNMFRDMDNRDWKKFYRRKGVIE